jgi:hypothetical protein
MQWQLRIYRAKEGALGSFIDEWRRHLLPLREAMGFEVIGPWVTGDGRFVWILGHDDLASADAAYYASPERAAVDPDPARHLADAQHIDMEPR